MSVAVPPPWRNKNVANLDLQKYCCIPESGNILPSALVNNCNFPFIIFLAFHFLLQEAPRSSFNKVLIDFEEFHFWPCEGSENGKLQKDSPQRQLPREVPNRPKITLSLHFNKVLIDFEAFHFWPCEGSGNGKLQKDMPQRQLQREMPRLPQKHNSPLET